MEEIAVTISQGHSRILLDNWAFSVKYTLTKSGIMWYNSTMKTMSDILKKAILDSGLSNLSLAGQAGVNRQSIARFLSGDTTITLEQAERLAAFLGLELRPIKTATRKKARE